MITHISIRDFATIDSIEIDMKDGLSVITGETGAGKSVIIEAISLALGSRADSSMVRSGRNKAVIQIVAEFGPPDCEKTQAIAESGQTDLAADQLSGKDRRTDNKAKVNSDDDKQVILTREISSGGKSIVRINGEIVPISRLSVFTAKMVDIHGQYDHQSLFNIDSHLMLVDSFHSNSIRPIAEQVSEKWKEYKVARNNMAELLRKESDMRRRVDFMRYELDEIKRIDPKPDEDVLLRERLAILQNSEHIFERLVAVRTALFDSAAPSLDSLGTAMHALNEISGFSKELAGIRDAISECYYTIEDLSGPLRSISERVEFSPATLNEVVSRLDTIEKLTSKHGADIESILKYKEKLTIELHNIENIDAVKADLSSVLADKEHSLEVLSKKLTALRIASARELEKRINEELNGLNFKNAHFSIAFIDQGEVKEHFSENGVDRIEFLISTNKGQPLLPLVKIASGGEMSRMMLAFKAVTGEYDRIPTMIFDEIDNGVSGVTASVVGKKLTAMSKKRQVICVTHLPQIAACGEQHLVISKRSDDSATYTTISELDDESRANEIARLLGGVNVTETTLKSARELISLSRG